MGILEKMNTVTKMKDKWKMFYTLRPVLTNKDTPQSV